MILAVILPFAAGFLLTSNGLELQIAMLGMLTAVFVSVVIVDQFSKRRKLPSASEAEKY
jgi:hypothetical protein